MLSLEYFKPFKTVPSGAPAPLSVIKNPYAIWLFNPLVSQALTDKNCMDIFKEGHCKNDDQKSVRVTIVVHFL